MEMTFLAMPSTPAVRPAGSHAHAGHTIQPDGSSVDIGLALPAGVVDVGRLELGEEVDGHAALLAGADSGALHAPEGQVRLAAHGRRIHMGDAGLDAVQEAEHAR